MRFCLQFLHDNAMQVAGALQLIIGGILVFANLTGPQTAYLATLPSGVGTILAGTVINIRKNGNGSTGNRPTPP